MKFVQLGTQIKTQCKKRKYTKIHKKFVTTVPCNLSLITALVGDCRSFTDIYVSRGSVATHMRCGGIRHYVAIGRTVLVPMRPDNYPARRQSWCMVPWGPIYKISYDLSYDYRKFIVRSTYDSDLKRAEISLRNIVS